MISTLFGKNSNNNKNGHNKISSQDMKTYLKSTNFSKNEILLIYGLFQDNSNNSGLISFNDAKKIAGFSITPMYLYIISREIEIKQFDNNLIGLDFDDFIKVLNKLHENTSVFVKCEYLFKLLKSHDKECLDWELFKNYIIFISYSHLSKDDASAIAEELWNEITKHQNDPITIDSFVKLCRNYEIVSLLTMRLI